MVRRVAALCALGVVLALAGCDRGRSDDLAAARSPDGRIVISAGLARGGVLSVRVRRDGADLIASSPVGLALAGEPAGATVIVSRARRLLDLELRAMNGTRGRDAGDHRKRDRGLRRCLPDRHRPLAATLRLPAPGKAGARR